MDFTGEDILAERQMLEAGEARFDRQMGAAVASGRETGMGPQRFLFKRAIRPTFEHLVARLDELETQSGRPRLILGVLREIDLMVLAETACRTILDSLHAAHTWAAMAGSIGRATEQTIHLDDLKRRDRMLWKRILRDTKHRPSGRGKKLRDLASDFGPQWTATVRRHLGIFALESFIEATGLVEKTSEPVLMSRAILPGRNTKRRTAHLVSATEATMEWLAKAIAEAKGKNPVFAPTDSPPRDWDGVTSGGYRTDIMDRRPFLDRWRSKELSWAEHESVQRHLDGVNVLQQTQWSINQVVLEAGRHCWENGIELPGMPNATERAWVPRPPESAGNEAIIAWGQERSLAMRLNQADKAKRLTALVTMRQADYWSDRPFYLPWKGDFRGRLYPIPPYLNPQAADFGRALLQFSEGKWFSKTDPGAYSWFVNHGANAFGVKGTHTEKKAWFLGAKGWIQAIGDDPLSETSWMQADEPWQFLAWAIEAADLLKYGAVCSRIPISMDGTNNGLQIYALLLRDRELAIRTSCTNRATPGDVYSDVAAKLTTKLEELTEGIDLRNPAEAVLAHHWLEFLGGTVPRSLCKKPVMTLPYSSTLTSCGDGVVAWFEEQIDAGAKRPPFYSDKGKDDYWKPCGWLAKQLWATVEETVPQAVAAMTWLQECASILVKHDAPIRWTTPSGWRVLQSRKMQKRRRTKIRSATGRRHSVTVSWNTTSESLAKNKAAIAPNFVHSLDAAALVRTALLAHSRGVGSFSMIHDSFATHAADAPTLANSLREAYGTMFADQNLLEILKRDLEEGLPPHVALPDPPSQGDFDPREVSAALYFFS